MRIINLAALVIALSCGAALANQRPYRFDSLGSYFFPWAINDGGQVVGYDSRNRGYGPALLWHGGQVMQLGTGEANDINDHGMIVLSAPISAGGPAVLLAPDGTPTTLSLPNGWGSDFRHQYSINNHGQVAGMEKFANSGTDGQAFLSDAQNVTFLNLGAHVRNSSAHDINDSGQVAGRWNGVGSSGGGFLWQDGMTTYLPAVGLSVNNRGQVVLYNGEVWDAGATTPVPTLPLSPIGDPRLPPRAILREINDLGQVVGWSEEYYNAQDEQDPVFAPIERGIIWDAELGLRDLNTLMGFAPDQFNNFPLDMPMDINNAGQIIGWGSAGGWMLTPIPEPATAALLLAAGWYVAHRRRGILRIKCPDPSRY